MKRLRPFGQLLQLLPRVPHRRDTARNFSHVSFHLRGIRVQACRSDGLQCKAVIRQLPPNVYARSPFSTSLAETLDEEFFATEEEHLAFLNKHAQLPAGFSVGMHTFGFNPQELPSLDAKMTLSLLALDDPNGSASWSAMFTRNAFPGSPVIVGRDLLADPDSRLRAICVNNKISNVFPGGNGVQDARDVAEAALQALPGYEAVQNTLLQKVSVLPSSTGIIGWRIPVAEMIDEMPALVESLQSNSILPAARGIMTTDLFPKVRSMEIECDDGSIGRLVGIARGAGMVEPNMATMLVFFLTDIALPRGRLDLEPALTNAVNTSFNRISIDADTSTSDTVVCVSSDLKPCHDVGAFSSALSKLSVALSDDVVRNGEGVSHVIRVSVIGAPTEDIASGVGKSIVNSPLFKSAVCGNDPNVGRLASAIGKFFGWLGSDTASMFDPNFCRMSIGGVPIFQDGQFTLDIDSEELVAAHMQEAQLYTSSPAVDPETKHVTYPASVSWPRHKRCVEVEIDLGMGSDDYVSTSSDVCSTNNAVHVLGASLTHEYVSENADYRS